MNIDVYRVVNWDGNFEGAKSKTYNNKSSCMMPTKHGLGFHRIIQNKDGSAIFGAWCAMIQVISRHSKPRQGYLTDDGRVHGKPYTPSDLELLTGVPSKYFTLLFPLAQSVGWLTLTSVKDTTGIVSVPTVSLRYPSNSNLDSNLNSNLNSDSNSPPKSPTGGGGDVFKPMAIDLPEDISREVWKDFCRMRKGIKKPLSTMRACNGVLNKATKLHGDSGMSKDDLITLAVEKSWQTVYVPNEESDIIGTDKDPLVIEIAKKLKAEGKHVSNQQRQREWDERIARESRRR